MKELLIDTIIEMAKKEQRLQSRILNLETKLNELRLQSLQKDTKQFNYMVKEAQNRNESKN